MNKLLLVAALSAAIAPPSSPRADQQVRLDAEARERAGIRVAVVSAGVFSDELRVVGEITRASASTVTVRTMLHGHVEEIHVAPGDTVRAGDLLLEVHSHALQELHAELLRLVREVRLAEGRYQAGLELLEVEGISRLEVEARELAVAGLRTDREVLETTLLEHGQTREELDTVIESGQPHPFLHLRAPRGGVILELPVEPDAWLAELEPLVVIGDPSRLELHLEVPPDEAASISPGDLVAYTPVGRPLAAGRARVLTRVPQVDPATRMVTIRCELLERTDSMIPGVLVEGSIQRGGSSPVAVVPTDAVSRIAGQDIVFVQVDADTFTARPVILGPARDGSYPVLSGIDVGEPIAVAGVFLLKSALLRGNDGEAGAA